jgi:transposase InsO family protein
MRLHRNAALSWRARRQLAERVVVEGWTLTAAAEAAGVSMRCARKWVSRYRVAGEEGLADRSSAPLRVANRTAPERVAAILALRQLRMTAAEIAEVLRMPLSTVSAVLKRNGVGRLGRIGLEPARRYEHSRPGELVHIDVKKLGRIEGGAGKRVGARTPGSYRPRRKDLHGSSRGTIGWEYVHIAVDDHSRLAYAEVLPDEKATTATGFLRRAIRFYRRHGITVQRILTDNGSAYISTIHALCCRQLGIRHHRTRPRRPQTNGKAERFIRTLVNGWAYGAIYSSSRERTNALAGWLWHYNHQRRHSALGHQPPHQQNQPAWDLQLADPPCEPRAAQTAVHELDQMCHLSLPSRGSEEAPFCTLAGCRGVVAKRDQAEGSKVVKPAVVRCRLLR